MSCKHTTYNTNNKVFYFQLFKLHINIFLHVYNCIYLSKLIVQIILNRYYFTYYNMRNYYLHTCIALIEILVKND